MHYAVRYLMCRFFRSHFIFIFKRLHCNCVNTGQRDLILLQWVKFLFGVVHLEWFEVWLWEIWTQLAQLAVLKPNKQKDPTCKTRPKFLTVSGWDVSVGTRLDVILLQRVRLLHFWVILIKDLSGLLTFRHCAGADIRRHAAAGGVGRVVTGMDLDLVAGEVAQVGDDGGFLGVDSDHSLCAFKGLPVLVHWDVCALRRAWGSGEEVVRSVGDAHHSASLPRASR